MLGRLRARIPRVPRARARAAALVGPGSRDVRRLGVPTALSPDDVMLAAAPTHYWSWGRNCLRCVERGLRTAGMGRPASLLDFGAGHGRGTRWFVAAYPDADVHATDVMPGGVAFCERELGVTGHVVEPELRDVDFGRRFDVIWVASVVTHLDAGRWPVLLDVLDRHLAPGGIAIVTTHGSNIAGWMHRGARLGLPPAEFASVIADHGRTGFGYADYPWTPGYGISLSSADWVRETVAREQPGWRLLEHVPAGWGSSYYGQDVWTWRPSPPTG